MRNPLVSFRLLAQLLPLLVVFLPNCTQAAKDSTEVHEQALEGLEYRLVGPWRGGRVTAVTGVPGQANL